MNMKIKIIKQKPGEDEDQFTDRVNDFLRSVITINVRNDIIKSDKGISYNVTIIHR